MHTTARSLILLLACLSLACSDDSTNTDEVGETSESSDSSSSDSSDSGTSESESSESADTESESGDSSEDATTTDSTESETDTTESETDTTSETSETEGTCGLVEILATVDHPAFTGESYCEGVLTNAVLKTQAEVDAHTDAYCQSLAQCFFPEPPCPGELTLSEGRMLIYAVGEGSGCSLSMTIAAIEDCGDHLEVIGNLNEFGGCAVIGYGFQAVEIAATDKPVQFVIQ